MGGGPSYTGGGSVNGRSIGSPAPSSSSSSSGSSGGSSSGSSGGSSSGRGIAGTPPPAPTTGPYVGVVGYDPTQPANSPQNRGALAKYQAQQNQETGARQQANLEQAAQNARDVYNYFGPPQDQTKNRDTSGVYIPPESLKLAEISASKLGPEGSQAYNDYIGNWAASNYNIYNVRNKSDLEAIMSGNKTPVRLSEQEQKELSSKEAGAIINATKAGDIGSKEYNASLDQWAKGNFGGFIQNYGDFKNALSGALGIEPTKSAGKNISITLSENVGINAVDPEQLTRAAIPQQTGKGSSGYSTYFGENPSNVKGIDSSLVAGTRVSQSQLDREAQKAQQNLESVYGRQYFGNEKTVYGEAVGKRAVPSPSGSGFIYQEIKTPVESSVVNRSSRPPPSSSISTETSRSTPSLTAESLTKPVKLTEATSNDLVSRIVANPRLLSTVPEGYLQGLVNTGKLNDKQVTALISATTTYNQYVENYKAGKSTNPELESSIIGSIRKNPTDIKYYGADKNSYLYSLAGQGVLTPKSFEQINQIVGDYNQKGINYQKNISTNPQLEKSILTSIAANPADLSKYYGTSKGSFLVGLQEKGVIVPKDIDIINSIAKNYNQEQVKTALTQDKQFRNYLESTTEKGAKYTLIDATGNVIGETSGTRAYHDILEARKEYGPISISPTYPFGESIKSLSTTPETTSSSTISLGFGLGVPIPSQITSGFEGAKAGLKNLGISTGATIYSLPSIIQGAAKEPYGGLLTPLKTEPLAPEAKTFAQQYIREDPLSVVASGQLSTKPLSYNIGAGIAIGAVTLAGAKDIIPLRAVKISPPIGEAGEQVTTYRGLVGGYGGPKSKALIGLAGGKFIVGEPKPELLQLEKINPAGRGFEIGTGKGFETKLLTSEPYLKYYTREGILTETDTQALRLLKEATPLVAKAPIIVYSETFGERPVASLQAGAETEAQISFLQGQQPSVKNLLSSVGKGQSPLFIGAGKGSFFENPQLPARLRVQAKDIDYDIGNTPKAYNLTGRNVERLNEVAVDERGFMQVGGKVYSGYNPTQEAVFPKVELNSNEVLSGRSLSNAEKIKEGVTPLEEFSSRGQGIFAFKGTQEGAESYANRAALRTGETPVLTKISLNTNKILRFKDIPKSIRINEIAPTKAQVSKEGGSGFYWSALQKNLINYAKREGYGGIEKPYKTLNPNTNIKEVIIFDRSAIKSTKIIEPKGTRTVVENPQKVVEYLNREDIGTDAYPSKSKETVMGIKYPKDTVKIEGIRGMSLSDQVMNRIASASSLQGPLSDEASRVAGLASKGYTESTSRVGPPPFREKDIVKGYKGMVGLSENYLLAGKQAEATRLRTIAEEYKSLYPELDFSKNYPESAKIPEAESIVPSIASGAKVSSYALPSIGEISSFKERKRSSSSSIPTEESISSFFGGSARSPFREESSYYESSSSSFKVEPYDFSIRESPSRRGSTPEKSLYDFDQSFPSAKSPFKESPFTSPKSPSIESPSSFSGISPISIPSISGYAPSGLSPISPPIVPPFSLFSLPKGGNFFDFPTGGRDFFSQPKGEGKRKYKEFAVALEPFGPSGGSLGEYITTERPSDYYFRKAYKETKFPKAFESGEYGY